MTTTPSPEERAYDYLRFIRGQEIADWARQERNGTWTTVVEMFREQEESAEED